MFDIKKHRENIGMTMQELADVVGVSKSTISKWEKGSIKNMRRDKIEKLAIALKIKPSIIIGMENDTADPLDDLTNKYSNIKRIQMKKFPLFGEIACGEPIYADEDKESFVMADMDIDADFCLTAKGDSMINARIYDGDIVFIKKMPIVDNGAIAAVIIDDEATLKRVYYYPEKNKLVLQAENPKYEPFVYLNEELEQIRILGKAVYFMSEL